MISVSNTQDHSSTMVRGEVDQASSMVTVKPEILLHHDGNEYQAQHVVLPGLTQLSAVRHALPEIAFASGDNRSPLVASLILTSDEGSGLLNFVLTLRNPLPMDHPGGNWDLGSEGGVSVKEFAVVLNLQGGNAWDEMTLDLLDSGKTIQAKQEISIFQVSSGGENWRSENHVDAQGLVTLMRRGYQVHADGKVFDGLRAVPVLSCRTGSTSVAIALRSFWQDFPSSLSATKNTLRFGLFPKESMQRQELQGGEQKTFEFAMQISAEQSKENLKLFAQSLDLEPDSERLQKCEQWPYLTPPSNKSDDRYRALVDLAIEGDDSFYAKREQIDEYGWRNFGDVYGDHEAVYHRGDSLMISHYNNQYDCTLGFGIQYLRSRDKRWLDLMLPMADHAWDIDTYHTNHDKLLYNGGLFWHTYHYADAHTATHRSYPKQLRVSQSFDHGKDLGDLGVTGEQLTKNYAIGGGPAASHNYSTGWMLAYYLTGKERYRDAAINAADYVMRIEDGSKTPFRWLSRADTGFSTCSSDSYYGPGRASGNSTHALLTGHELTGDKKYLDRGRKTDAEDCTSRTRLRGT